MEAIELSLSRERTPSGMEYQHLRICLNQPDGIVTPADLTRLKLPPSLDPLQGVVLEGRAPIWLYGYLVHLCHVTAWVACYDPRLAGAVVVESHVLTAPRVGTVVPLAPPA